MHQTGVESLSRRDNRSASSVCKIIGVGIVEKGQYDEGVGIPGEGAFKKLSPVRIS